MPRIEDCASGAVACQIFDRLHPPGTGPSAPAPPGGPDETAAGGGSAGAAGGAGAGGAVQMSRVCFKARSEYEFVNNYKILQKVFDKCAVDKVRAQRLPSRP